MVSADQFILGEYRRTFDERYRLALPAELIQGLSQDGSECVLAKERAGCLSLWHRETWRLRLEQGVNLVRAKLDAGRLTGRTEEIQQLGRLLSTRHRDVKLMERGRLLVPEGFREFLGVEPGGEVMLVGAAICVEIWQPTAWLTCLQEQMPAFHRTLEELAN
ncbi:MAG: division/cell wall cluster transcriptional repressor MraZ [Planctomycetota bacterium]|nr:division/cell wall cluster transcriptional repressor MraZ [Planctomycetota bacterium]MDA1179094.1 division/cell wall cluster transcriptional repressor MraZ [Planctomycetota bacterium]